MDFLGRGGGAAYPETVSLYAPNPSPFSGSPVGLTALDERARDIFRRIVETYLETGDPVGSRTLSQTGIALSPACWPLDPAAEPARGAGVKA